MTAPTKIARQGYQNFGSFMGDNVQDLIAVPAVDYTPPPLPFAQPPPLSSGFSGNLGDSLRSEFFIDFNSWTFVNHGAFGGVCRAAQAEAALWRDHCEAQPLSFIDRELFPHVVRVIREMAEFVGCRPADLVFTPNATTGLNTVIQSLQLSPGDCVFMLDIGYGSVKKMLEEVCQRSGAQLTLGPINFPLAGEDDIVAAVAGSLPANCRLAVFDAVTSNTAVALPLTRLVAMCKQRGVQVLIDGAHALGMLPLDLNTLAADYFVSNCHKWLCAPRGSAILWVAPQHQRHIRPLIISHGFGAGFTSDFIWDGCRDYAPILGVSAALRFWAALGPDRVRAYMTSLLAQAVQLLTAAWGTGTLVPLSMCGSMALVGLPPGLVAAPPSKADPADAKFVQDLLYANHRVECPVKCIQGTLYVRISAAPYNVPEDYRQLLAAVAALQLEGSAREVAEDDGDGPVCRMGGGCG